ncbi:MAG TPA: GntR family transcriptional regulator [Euzebyales bacterium]|nr:GntR family transcriptional regulator [Euzebyales bacterium]
MKISRHVGDPRTAQAYVRNNIRAAIFSGEIRAGDRLVQADIARQLNVSTTPVREALRQLATEGLLRLDAHHGALVRDLDPVELREIHEMRQLLEPEIMRRALPRLTPDQLDEAELLLRKMTREDGVAGWAELNRAFHRIFLDACGSRTLAETVANLQDRYAAYIVASTSSDPQRREHSNDEHRDILDAARARDVAAATQAILVHIQAPMTHHSDNA